MIHVLTLKRTVKSFHGLCGFKTEYARLYIVSCQPFDYLYLNGKPVLFEHVEEMKAEWEFCFEVQL